MKLMKKFILLLIAIPIISTGCAKNQVYNDGIPKDILSMNLK